MTTAASAPIERAAARVLCLDPTGAVLVESVVDPAVPDVLRWVSPGGGIEPGESPHAAARRELWEETGLSVDDLGAPVASMSNEFGWDGRRYLGHNTFYAVRTERFVPVPRGMTAQEQSVTRGAHWLLPDELDALAATAGHDVSPAAIAGWVRRLHGELAPETVRPTVRVLLVDPDDRVLLMRASVNGSTFWFPPGGGVEPGETMLEAARRELREETGLIVEDVGPWVWARRHVLAREDGGLDLRERYHLLRVVGLEPDRTGWTPLEVETIDDLRWWSAEQVHAERHETFTPRALATLLPQLLADDRAGRLAGRAPQQVPV